MTASTRTRRALPARTCALLATLPKAPKGWTPPRTQAEFAALAKQAEHDLKTVAFLEPRRGRPATGEDRTSVQTAIRLPTPLMNAVRSRAKQRHLTVSAALREAVTAWAIG